VKASFLGTAALSLAGRALAGVTSEPIPLTSRPPQSTIQPSLSSIYAAAATTEPQSPVSNVAGKAFDRIIQIWLENTDFNVGHRYHSLIVGIYPC
jgi:acid phosphatase